MSQEVFFIKLVSGEEIVAERVDPGSSFVNCLQVFLQPQPDGHVGVQFLPWPFIVEENEPIVIDPTHIIFMNTPRKDILDMHRERFGKIQLVSNPGILHS